VAVPQLPTAIWKREDPVEGGNQGVFVERLAQGRHVEGDSILEEAIPITCDEYQREQASGGVHLFAKLGPAQTGQADIKDEAVGINGISRKLFRGCEQANLIVHRSKKPIQRSAHVRIVIDHCDDHVSGVYHR